MLVYSDNKGAVDLINGWSIGGGTKHMDCRIMFLRKLKVRKPMLVYSDNKGAVDLINGWSIGGGTKHMDCRIMFLRELNEDGVIRVQ